MHDFAPRFPLVGEMQAKPAKQFRKVRNLACPLSAFDVSRVCLCVRYRGKGLDLSREVGSSGPEVGETDGVWVDGGERCEGANGCEPAEARTNVS